MLNWSGCGDPVGLSVWKQAEAETILADEGLLGFFDVGAIGADVALESL